MSFHQSMSTTLRFFCQYFITFLYSLVEHCKYGALSNEKIRDRIVVDILKSNLSEQLQLDGDLTLAKAI